MSCLEIMAEPLSKYTTRGIPRAEMPARSAASSRTVSSLWPQRYPVRAREWSSMNANRYVLRPATTGPCSASPVQRSLGAAASNRPNALGAAPSGRVLSSRRGKGRWRGRADGAQHQRGRVGLGVAGCGDQGVEAAGPPGPDPPVQGDPGNPDPVPERAQMVLFGELAHQRPALTGRQRGICYRADQRIPEQPNLLCPLSAPAAACAICLFVAHSPPPP